MNKLIITIVTALLLSATGTAFARDFYGDPGRKGHRNHHPMQPMQPMPLAGQVIHVFKHLDLSDEQKDNIKAVMKALRTEVHPIMLEMRSGHQQLKELIKAESYDEQAVTALAEKEGQLAARRIMLTGEALSKAFACLTDEQRAQLDTMATERKERRAERRKLHAMDD